MDPRLALHTDWQHSKYPDLLAAPVTAFVGIDVAGSEVLRRLHVATIFDLGNSAPFMAAELLTLAAQDAAHPFTRLGRVAGDLVQGSGSQLPVEEWPRQPARVLSGVGQVVAEHMARTFDVHTIGEFASWGPYQSAKEIVRLAAGGLEVAPGQEEPSTPPDLLPSNGQYPTDRVYYRNILLRKFADVKGEPSLDAASGVDLGIAATKGVSGFGYGAYVTWEQVWYGQGLVLGSLLHSLALAPGEATMVAVIDWTRSVSATTAESIDQLESLSASTEQNRALSEVTHGVASEVQSGFSNTTGSSTTSGVGATMGGAGSAGATLPIPGLPINVSMGGGFGVGGATSTTSGQSTTVAFTTGTRETFADYAQNISESTQQQATSARSRRASIVQEVRESTTETLQTRVVANYNHMHALSVCYYEVVQVFRVVLQASRVEKCAFVPITPLDFTDDAMIDRFAGILRQVARDPYLVKVLAMPVMTSLVAPLSGAVYKRLPSMQTLPTATSTAAAVGRRARTRSRTLSSDGRIDRVDSATSWWDVLHPATAVEIPGPLQVSPTARFTSLSASADETAVNLTVTMADGLAMSPASTTVDWAVLDVESVLVLVPESLNASTVTLTMGVTEGSLTQHYSISVPTTEGLADGTQIQIVTMVVVGGDVSPTEMALARAHLIAESAWYTARIWERVDVTTISALLAQYRFSGQPLLSHVDPRLLAVTGTHAVFRMLLDEAGKLDWLKELDSWGLTGADSRREDLVPLPTGGVFAEAVLGRSNSAEKLDLTRFWNWQDSPPPFAPPAIAALQAGQQPTTAPAVPGQLDAPIINMVQPNALPMPTGLGATLGLLQAANIFRDMSFASTNADAMSALAAASATAQAAALQAAQQAFATAANLATSASLTGALVNAGNQGLLPPPPPPPGPAPAPAPAPSPSPAPSPTPAPPAPTPAPPAPAPAPPAPTPAPPPAPTPAPTPAPPPEPPSPNRTFSLKLSVPYPLVLIAPVSAVRAAIPPQVTMLIGTPLEIMMGWTEQVGFDSEETELLTKALTYLGTLTVPGLGEIVLIYEGLSAVIDFVGFEGLVSSETRDFVIERLWAVTDLLQAVLFPSISGGDWLSLAVEASVEAGQVHQLVLPNPVQLNHGALTHVVRNEAQPWWSAEGGSILPFPATFDTASLEARVEVQADGAYLATLKGAPTLSMSWPGVLAGLAADANLKLAEIAARLATEDSFLTALADRLGVSDALASMTSAAQTWFDWWGSNFYAVLHEITNVQVNFDFAARIAPNDIGTWTVTVTSAHDQFPHYVLTLEHPEEDPIELYSGPPLLEASALGPFALAWPTVISGPPRTVSVPFSWFQPWIVEG